MSAPSEKVEHFANIKRKVVLHRMATADSLDDQLFWGIVLWSWCGPETGPTIRLPGQHGMVSKVVLKDKNGFLRRDNFENPISAKLTDLRELMGWPKGMKGEVSRIIQRLKAQNSVCLEHGILYAVEEPSGSKTPKVVAGTRNWCIGRMVVGTRNLPTDPEARSEAIQWLEETSTAWKKDLKTLRTDYRDKLVQAAQRLGIIIVFKEKKRRSEEEGGSSSSEVDFPAVELQKAEEEDPPPTYATFKSLYPEHRFDEGKAKPAFEALKKPERTRVIAQLRVYLACPRWVNSLAEDNGKWVPLASNWLKTYEADPPPLLRKHDAGNESLKKQAEHIDRVVKMSRVFRGVAVGGKP